MSYHSTQITTAHCALWRAKMLANASASCRNSGQPYCRLTTCMCQRQYAASLYVLPHSLAEHLSGCCKTASLAPAVCDHVPLFPGQLEEQPPVRAAVDSAASPAGHG